MPAPDWEDLDVFLDEDEFACRVFVQRADGVELSLSGLFEDAYYDAQLGEYAMDSIRPRVWCQRVDVPGVQRGDTCRIEGTRYDILTEPQGDGTGMAMLELAVRNEPA
ncbi:hypothetical protein C7446_2314 [Kushneria sinocarnis]|uniref:Head-tail adaptor n=1 Tax=Kushneria sinocarnis TaxID=595502 RepID=A0A420WVL4_9GAMM|nr:hypothetical protein [Kushneria sinocarnis]RKR02596.1 hypothetical protein C7446_2314 [Kushneria sinocarnis]